jgi:UDP-N-acetylmuramate dehydrogenase
MTRDWTALAPELASLDGVSATVREPMDRHTSLGVGGPADLWVRVHGEDALAAAIGRLEAEGCPWMAVGGGTNLLVTDEGIEGAVVTLAGEFSTLRFEGLPPGAHGQLPASRGHPGALPAGNREPSRSVLAGASVTVARLLREIETADAWGLEFLSGVPGTVGGAVRMNAGTRHGYVESALVEARLWSAAGASWRPAATMGLTYRGCALPAGTLIVAARFALHEGRPEAARRVVEDLETTRSLRHPPMAGTAGSFFKNPDIAAGLFAGMLIEGAGLKGHRHGGALVSPVHANFLSNGGAATARDLLELAGHVRAEVERTAGVRMTPEVRIVGRGAEAWRARLGAEEP